MIPPTIMLTATTPIVPARSNLVGTSHRHIRWMVDCLAILIMICVLRNMAKKRAPRDSLVIGGYGIDPLLGRLAKGGNCSIENGNFSQNAAKQGNTHIRGSGNCSLISKSGQSDSKIETLSAVKTDVNDVTYYIFFCRIIFNIFLLKSLREWKNSSSERDSDCFSEIICTVHIRSATCNRT